MCTDFSNEMMHCGIFVWCTVRFMWCVQCFQTEGPGEGVILLHHNDVIMSTMASQITSRTIVYSTAYSGAVQRKHQSSTSLAFVWGIHRWPVNSPHKVPVKRKMFPFDDVIMVGTRVGSSVRPSFYPRFCITSNWLRLYLFKIITFV